MRGAIRPRDAAGERLLQPGQWQTYDIIYHRPIFDQSGKVTRKAVFTVIHNGVLIQDHVALEGGTDWLGPHAITDYAPHGDKGPLMSRTTATRSDSATSGFAS